MDQSPFIIREKIISERDCEPIANVGEGVELCTFVSAACGTKHFSTGLAKFRPGARLPYHTHSFSEAVTVLEGQARVLVEGRGYRLGPKDCIHFPEGIAHQIENEDPFLDLNMHWAFATATPSRDLTDRTFPVADRDAGNPGVGDPETIVRYDPRASYELSKNAFFLDLFARRLGSIGICGGYGRFLPGSSLPCHIHDFDESITIIEGSAICLVEGKQYGLSGCDTAFVPKGLPHRFMNDSDDEMAMVWVYAGSEPDRRMVRSGYCSGLLAWPGADQAKEESE